MYVSVAGSRQVEGYPCDSFNLRNSIGQGITSPFNAALDNITSTRFSKIYPAVLFTHHHYVSVLYR